MLEDTEPATSIERPDPRSGRPARRPRRQPRHAPAPARRGRPQQRRGVNGILVTAARSRRSADERSRLFGIHEYVSERLKSTRHARELRTAPVCGADQDRTYAHIVHQINLSYLDLLDSKAQGCPGSRSPSPPKLPAPALPPHRLVSARARIFSARIQIVASTHQRKLAPFWPAPFRLLVSKHLLSQWLVFFKSTCLRMASAAYFWNAQSESFFKKAFVKSGGGL